MVIAYFIGYYTKKIPCVSNYMVCKSAQFHCFLSKSSVIIIIFISQLSGISAVLKETFVVGLLVSFLILTRVVPIFLEDNR